MAHPEAVSELFKCLRFTSSDAIILDVMSAAPTDSLKSLYSSLSQTGFCGTLGFLQSLLQGSLSYGWLDLPFNGACIILKPMPIGRANCMALMVLLAAYKGGILTTMAKGEFFPLISKELVLEGLPQGLKFTSRVPLG